MAAVPGRERPASRRCRGQSPRRPLTLSQRQNRRRPRGRGCRRNGQRPSNRIGARHRHRQTPSPGPRPRRDVNPSQQGTTQKAQGAQQHHDSDQRDGYSDGYHVHLNPRRKVPRPAGGTSSKGPDPAPAIRAGRRQRAALSLNLNAQLHTDVNPIRGGPPLQDCAGSPETASPRDLLRPSLPKKPANI